MIIGSVADLCKGGRKTRYSELEYKNFGNDWRLILVGSDGDRGVIGPSYATRAELLADLESQHTMRFGIIETNFQLAFREGFEGLPPQADTETLAAQGQRLLLYIGGKRQASHLQIAEQGELTAGWVIGLKRT